MFLEQPKVTTLTLGFAAGMVGMIFFVLIVLFSKCHCERSAAISEDMSPTFLWDCHVIAVFDALFLAMTWGRGLCVRPSTGSG